MRTERVCDDLIIERKSGSFSIGKILIAVILVGVLVWFAGWGRKMIPAFNPQNMVEEESTDDYFDFDDFYYDEITTTPAFDASASLDYARKQLSGAEAELYDMLYASFSNKEFTIVNGLDAVTPEKAQEVINYIMLDHPELFWLDGGLSWTEDNDTGYLQKIELNQDYGFICEPSKIASLEAAAFKAADEIIAQAENLGSDYEKAIFVHDLLVDKLTYSTSLVDRRFSLPKDTPEPTDISIGCSMYGALVDNLTVCEGYARAYQYIMKEMGIECTYIGGESHGEGHAWNLIRLDGEYYYVDVTWDDPVPQAGQEESLWHTYAFVTSEQFNKDHTPEIGDITLPVATATKCNYYRVNGIWMDSYSYEAAKTCIKNCFDKNLPIEFGLSDKAETDKAMAALFDNGDFNKIMEELGKETGAVSYTYLGTAIKIYL